MTRTTTSDDLLRFAENAGIEVYETHIPRNGSVSVEVGDGVAIGIDSAPCTEALRRVRLAHEIGHCVRHEFYNVYSPFDVREKHERKADEWAIRKLIPRYDFLRAVRRGCTEPYQIAEEFGVTIPFAVKTMRFYGQKT